MELSNGNGGNNQTPDPSNWITDPSVWNDADSSQEEEEKDPGPGKLDVEVDFGYQDDSNGNPNLLIPNTGALKKKRAYTKVEFDQTATHMHHAPDFGIPLLANFDMNKYQSMDRAGKLAYVEKMLPRETVIRYQNEIGKTLCPIFNIPGTNYAVSGFAGRRKINTDLTIQQMTNGSNMLGIIREDGTHISSYPVDATGLQSLVDNNFWVLRNRDL